MFGSVRVSPRARPEIPWFITGSRLLAFYGFLGAPLTSAAFLTLRLGRRTRQAASFIPIAAGLLVGAMLLMLFVIPTDPRDVYRFWHGTRLA